MEQEDRAFHQRVRDGYLELARSEPKRFTVLNADKPLQEVITDLRLALWKPLIEAGGPAGFSRSVELDRA
jgi:thymidylate kinase